jgi:hypothetical protein
MARRKTGLEDLREQVEDPDKARREQARAEADQRRMELAEEREARLRDAQQQRESAAEIRNQMEFEQKSWRSAIDEQNKEAEQFSKRGGIVDVGTEKGPYGDIKESKRIRRDEAGNPQYRPAPLSPQSEDPLEASSSVSYTAEGQRMRGYRTASGSFEYVDPTSEAAMAETVPAQMRPSVRPDVSGRVRVKPFEGEEVDYSGDPFASQRPEVRRAAQQAAEMKTAAEVGRAEERKRETQLNIRGATMLKDTYSKELQEKESQFNEVTREDAKLGRVPIKGKEKEFGTLSERIKALRGRIESIDTRLDEENARQAAIEDRKLESTETKKKISRSPLVPGE